MTSPEEEEESRPADILLSAIVGTELVEENKELAWPPSYRRKRRPTRKTKRRSAPTAIAKEDADETGDAETETEAEPDLEADLGSQDMIDDPVRMYLQ